MTDRIVLAGMAFLARHGVKEWEKVEEQRFEVDVELGVDLRGAAAADHIARTVDYRGVHESVRGVVEGPSVNLIETLAESIARVILATHGDVEEVVVRVRKPDVDLGGPLDHAGVEIRRSRSA